VETARLVVGKSYGFREKRILGSPVLRVTLLEKLGRKGRVRIRFENGPHRGLVEYAYSRQLVTPWGEQMALLRDETRLARLREYARTVEDGALVEAACAVLVSTGERRAWAGPAVTSMPEAQLRRICERAGIDLAPSELHPLGFTDRHARHPLPLDAVVHLARAFADAEPRTVIDYLDDYEAELRTKGNLPGER
jgi:hypothetical protein